MHRGLGFSGSTSNASNAVIDGDTGRVLTTAQPIGYDRDYRRDVIGQRTAADEAWRPAVTLSLDATLSRLSNWIKSNTTPGVLAVTGLALFALAALPTMTSEPEPAPTRRSSPKRRRRNPARRRRK